MHELTSPVERVSEDLAGLMPAFLDISRSDLGVMRLALAAGDFATLVRLGHSARGAGANYNMLGLCELGREIEAAARKPDPQALAGLLERMAQYLDAVRVEFVPE